MEKKYAIIEIKDKDLFVIYDMNNGGACCCTKYTIKQLLETKNVTIFGVDNNVKKSNYFECDLDGKPRDKKASNTCDDLTKRSLATILKGLDEKHYPRKKQVRCGKGKFTPKQTYFYHFQNEKGENIKQWCMFMPNGAMCFPNGNYHDATKVNSNLSSYVETNFSNKMNEMFNAIYSTFEKIVANKEKIVDMEKELQKAKNVINQEENNRKVLYDQLRKIRDEELLEEKIRNLEKETTGNECLSMSFYRGTLDKEKAIAIINKSSRKIVYTYGLKYRHPTTYEVPTAKEKAIEIIKKGSLIDVDFKENVIDIQEVSGNDMW